MGRILFLLCCLSLVSACVTEKTFIDSKKQVRSFDFDRDEAAKTRLILALSYLENNRFEQAKFNLEKALAFSPNRADVNFSLGYYYELVGEMDIAENYYLKAIDLEPQNPNTLNNYGTFLCKAGQLEKAAVYFKRAISISKYTRAADSYENLAICALSNDKVLQAQEYFEMSYKHNPGRPYSLLSLAGIKYATGDLVSSLDYYSRYQKMAISTPRSLMLGHIIENKRGRFTQANKYADQIVLEFPDSNEAQLITSNQTINSEFEQLRLKYQSTRTGSTPQIKIVRKSPRSPYNKTTYKKNTESSEASSKPAGSLPKVALALPESIVTAVKEVSSKAEFAEQLQQKVEMFSKPLTDTESVTIPEMVQSTVAIQKEAPLPEEEVLMKKVQPSKVINDRASTNNTRVYVTPELVDVIVPTYQVQSGDSLYRVSVKFNIKVSKLKEWNALSKDELTIGQTLFISKPDPVYTIEVEREVSDIANMFGIELNALLSWNGLDSDGWLKTGQKIMVADPDWYSSVKEQAENEKLGEPLKIDLPDLTIPTHTVKSGEFLYKISKNYNVKLDALITWNNLSPKASLVVGQKLFVANPDIYYTVMKTQSVSSVSQAINIDLANLMEWNKITSEGVIAAGTKLLKVNPEQYQ